MGQRRTLRRTRRFRPGGRGVTEGTPDANAEVLGTGPSLKLKITLVIGPGLRRTARTNAEDEGEAGQAAGLVFFSGEA